MVKLIVTDMDGTLLNDQKEIDPSFWETFRELRNRGIHFAVASGRQFYTLQDQFEDIKNEIVIISDNGAYVADENGPISHTAFSKEDVKIINSISAEIKDAWLVCSGLKSGYVMYDGEVFLEKVRTYYKKLQIVKNVEEVDDEIIKMTYCDFANSTENSLQHFQDLRNDYNIVIAGYYWLDITPKTASKGKALESLQKSLGITAEETMLFGDHYNDLSMMTKAKYSYAMKNAQPGIIDAANFITRLDNNENGVVETIREMVLN